MTASRPRAAASRCVHERRGQARRDLGTGRRFTPPPPPRRTRCTRRPVAPRGGERHGEAVRRTFRFLPETWDGEKYDMAEMGWDVPVHRGSFVHPPAPDRAATVEELEALRARRTRISGQPVVDDAMFDTVERSSGTSAATPRSSTRDASTTCASTRTLVRRRQPTRWRQPARARRLGMRDGGLDFATDARGVGPSPAGTWRTPRILAPAPVIGLLGVFSQTAVGNGPDGSRGKHRRGRRRAPELRGGVRVRRARVVARVEAVPRVRTQAGVSRRGCEPENATARVATDGSTSWRRDAAAGSTGTAGGPPRPPRGRVRRASGSDEAPVVARMF